jgi:crotonobetainyl-CoA:carnitine CoA-transferase CaiB-like acyl-CoA transferase
MLLKGVKVIEHATYYAAPGAGGILSDWGAEVIKIEPPGGDPVRTNFPTKGTGKEHLTDNPAFDGDNRGKKSIVVDTRTEDGREVVRKLADTADVFLTNVRPGGIERSGLGYDILSKRNPKLVYCALTGYGLEGPDANAPGFDVASFWSRSGLARLTAPKGAELFPIRTAAGDHTTSIAAVAAINAALIQALKTGKGQLVDVSLLRTGSIRSTPISRSSCSSAATPPRGRAPRPTIRSPTSSRPRTMHGFASLRARANLICRAWRGRSSCQASRQIRASRTANRGATALSRLRPCSMRHSRSSRRRKWRPA